MRSPSDLPGNWGHNPATALSSAPVPGHKKPVAVQDLAAVRAAIREWATAEKGNGPRASTFPISSRCSSQPVGASVKLLALRWSDIEMSPPPRDATTRAGSRG